MSLSFEWFAPAPADLQRSRITLHFGLRADDLFYRQLVVPQAGRIWFVRELSWALSALALMPVLEEKLSLVPSPTAVAHSLEALGSKLAWWDRGRPKPVPIRRGRLLGTRAFER